MALGNDKHATQRKERQREFHLRKKKSPWSMCEEGACLNVGEEEVYKGGRKIPQVPQRANLHSHDKQPKKTEQKKTNNNNSEQELVRQGRCIGRNCFERRKKTRHLIN